MSSFEFVLAVGPKIKFWPPLGATFSSQLLGVLQLPFAGPAQWSVSGAGTIRSSSARRRRTNQAQGGQPPLAVGLTTNLGLVCALLQPIPNLHRW